MPEVRVRYKPETVQPEELIRLSNRLPLLLAQGLTCQDEDGQLLPDDIEVEFSPVSADYDRTQFDVSITVLAQPYPSREAVLKDVVDWMRGHVASIFLGRKISVWIVIVKAGAFAA